MHQTYASTYVATHCRVLKSFVSSSVSSRTMYIHHVASHSIQWISWILSMHPTILFLHQRSSNALLRHYIQRCVGSSGNVNVFQWNKEWFFIRHIQFDTGFHAMTVNEISWYKPIIAFSFTIIKWWVLSSGWRRPVWYSSKSFFFWTETQLTVAGSSHQILGGRGRRIKHHWRFWGCLGAIENRWVPSTTFDKQPSTSSLRRRAVCVSIGQKGSSRCTHRSGCSSLPDHVQGSPPHNASWSTSSMWVQSILSTFTLVEQPHELHREWGQRSPFLKHALASPFEKKPCRLETRHWRTNSWGFQRCMSCAQETNIVDSAGWKLGWDNTSAWRKRFTPRRTSHLWSNHLDLHRKKKKRLTRSFPYRRNLQERRLLNENVRHKNDDVSDWELTWHNLQILTICPPGGSQQSRQSITS